MAGQPLVITFNSAVDEAALKCGDPFYKDFPKYIYQQAVYRAERSIAHDYKILDRILTVVNTPGTSPINISALNFSANVWRINVAVATVTGVGAEQEITYVGSNEQYQQRTVDEVLDNNLSNTANTNYYYAIIYNTNVYNLYYTFPAIYDRITIYYTAEIAGQEDYDTLDAEGEQNVLPAIPNEYFEETVRRAVLYMVKLGIAKYETGEKAQRYNRLLTIYTKRSDNTDDLSLGRDRAWIQIKPFQYP